ncbi:hypothetical protein [Cerasicoccus frondis]|uniref:hypothetical protein n=1 Tax=Cerasicoccus frondis TaxID=490090 RepID=UPI0028528892|nr:hypothetical protein [Cerasicoccus frondis]
MITATCRNLLGGAVLSGLLASNVQAILFFDNFDSGASPLWENNSGGWAASGGVYAAASPDNAPNALSALPYVLTDFEIELDINDVTDGGVWLHSTEAGGTSIGRAGVLLVAGAGGGDLYWHVVSDGTTYGSSLNIANGVFTVGVSDPHLRITVVGDTYSVYVDGSLTPATSLTDSTFSSGQVALYDNSLSNTFDNVSLVPEPSATAAGLGALVGLVVLMRRRRR